MNREIKFRIKRKFYDLYDKYIETKWEIITLEEGIMDVSNCLMETLEQYTGLKDIHGVEIYEGDEIEFNGTKGKVEWDNNTASFRFKSYTSIYSLAFLKYNIINIEVIGNIHER